MLPFHSFAPVSKELFLPLRCRPARLSLEFSIEESPDSHVTGGGAGGVAERRQEKRSSFLPEVVRTARTPPCESETHVPKPHSQTHVHI